MRMTARKRPGKHKSCSKRAKTCVTINTCNPEIAKRCTVPDATNDSRRLLSILPRSPRSIARIKATSRLSGLSPMASFSERQLRAWESHLLSEKELSKAILRAKDSLPLTKNECRERMLLPGRTCRFPAHSQRSPARGSAFSYGRKRFTETSTPLSVELKTTLCPRSLPSESFTCIFSGISKTATIGASRPKRERERITLSFDDCACHASVKPQSATKAQSQALETRPKAKRPAIAHNKATNGHATAKKGVANANASPNAKRPQKRNHLYSARILISLQVRQLYQKRERRDCSRLSSALLALINLRTCR